MIHGIDLFFGLFNNLAIFIVLIAVYSLLDSAFKSRKSIARQAVVGISFGIITLICMQVKIPVSEGVVVDQRNAIVILGGAFGGPVAGFIAAIFAGVYRVHLGGIGVVGGCLGLVLSAIAGSIIHSNRSRIDSVAKAALVSFVAAIFILPGFLPIGSLQNGLILMRAMALPYGLALFVGVFLTGLLLALEEYRHDIKVELSRSEKRYRELFESLLDVSIHTDANCMITIISPSCEKMFGYQPSELIGTSVIDYYKDPQVQAGLINILQEQGRGENYEAEIRKKDGEYLWVSINAGVNLNDNGENTGYRATVRDISQMKRTLEEKEQLQQKIVQIEKMESIGTLAGGIAHDVNNALAGIIGGAEMLGYDGITQAQKKKFMHIVLSSAEKAAELTKKLLTFSRKGAKEMRVVDVVNIINDTVLILRRTIDRKITVSSELLTVNTRVWGDDALLQNMLLNLGINAGHAMPDGGKLTITVDERELNRDYCEESPFELTCGIFLRIAVADTGCGIEPEIITQIFEPFFTTKEPGKGTGLGLAAAYGTVLDHHGAISVSSETGKGTVFEILIPLTMENTKDNAGEEVIPEGSGTILLIDDEDLVCDTVSSLLSGLGYDVLIANDGKKGLELFEQRRDAIQLVILDMIMPVMGGRQMFNALIAVDPAVRVIVAT